jgi:hypothetical protein
MVVVQMARTLEPRNWQVVILLQRKLRGKQRSSEVNKNFTGHFAAIFPESKSYSKNIHVSNYLL